MMEPLVIFSLAVGAGVFSSVVIHQYEAKTDVSKQIQKKID
jgi:hypothetical protein